MDLVKINELQQERDTLENEILEHQKIVQNAKISQKISGNYMEPQEFGSHKLQISEKTLKLHQVNRKIKELKTTIYCINDSCSDLISH